MKVQLKERVRKKCTSPYMISTDYDTPIDVSYFIEGEWSDAKYQYNEYKKGVERFFRELFNKVGNNRNIVMNPDHGVGISCTERVTHFDLPVLESKLVAHRGDLSEVFFRWEQEELI